MSLNIEIKTVLYTHTHTHPHPHPPISFKALKEDERKAGCEPRGAQGQENQQSLDSNHREKKAAGAIKEAESS